MGTLTFYYKWEHITLSCFSHLAQSEGENKYQKNLIFFSRLSVIPLNLTSNPLVLIVGIKIVAHNYVYSQLKLKNVGTSWKDVPLCFHTSCFLIHQIKLEMGARFYYHQVKFALKLVMSQVTKVFTNLRFL